MKSHKVVEKLVDIGLDFTLPECVNIRKVQKFMRAGKLFNGKPIKEIDGYFYVWERTYKWGLLRYKHVWEWTPVICTAKEYLKKGYCRSYSVCGWRFTWKSKNKKSEIGELSAMFNGSEDQIDFFPVIEEAKKRGYNVDEEFLKNQYEFVYRGYKVNRFLPDHSGGVFSPIFENGVIFRFYKITENSSEYIC